MLAHAHAGYLHSFAADSDQGICWLVQVSMAPSKMKADSMGEVAADDQENQPALDNVLAARATRSSARFQGKSQ